MQSIIVYYSLTGNTRTVARAIASQLEAPTVQRIRPITRRRYSNWLVRSCIPRSRVSIQPIETDLMAYDAAFLGTPKWTLSCPPVTEYIERATVTDTSFGIFVTYGGFDEDRYLNRLAERLEAKNGDVVATMRVQRDMIDTSECLDGVGEFCDAIIG